MTSPRPANARKTAAQAGTTASPATTRPATTRPATTRPDSVALETVVAIARHGSPTAAAEALGRNVTTTYRHVNTLEADLGIKIFDRAHSGWTIRPEGRALVDAGNEIERILQRSLSQARTQANFARGKLRIAVSDDFATAYLATRLRAFIDNHPDIQPDLIVSNTFADLARGDADVAIRPHRYPGDDLVGQQVAVMHHAIYATPAYLKKHGTPKTIADLQDHTVIGFGDSLASFTASTWFNDNIGHGRACAGLGSTMSMTNATASGLGLALLPCYIADSQPGLTHVMPVGEALAIEVWLVTHAPRKSDPNIRAFFRHFSTVMRADAALFAGKHVAAK